MLNQYIIVLRIAKLAKCVYIQANKLQQKGHETVVADGVRIDLPAGIVRIIKSPRQPSRCRCRQGRREML